MSTRTGFPRMDWDTGFLADPKFQHLRDLLPDPVTFGYAGFCYLRLAADAWRTCERRTVSVAVRGITSESAAALEESGLLQGGMIPESTFDQWIGAAVLRRKADADRKSRTPSTSTGVLPTRSDSTGVQRDVGSDGSEVGRNGRTGGSRGDTTDKPFSELVPRP